MLTKQSGLKIAQQFVAYDLPKKRWYRMVRTQVLAILLYGSVAKGTNRADSDIDILIILPLEHEEKFTQGEYVYEYQGCEINIVLRSIEQLRKIANEHHDVFQKEVFRESEIIESNGEEVVKLLKLISKI